MSVRRNWRRVALGALGAVILVDAARILFWRPYAVSGAAPDDGLTRVSGVLHVHTTLSDGGGTPEQVIAAAQEAGLGFLAITDHNNLEARRLEGYHGRLLVMVGTEISTSRGHVLALGIREPTFRFSGDLTDALDDVRHLGGLAFAAHPDSPRNDLAWNGDREPGPWGIEVLNGDSQFRLASWAGRARTATTYALNPRYALLSHMSRPAHALRMWDALLAYRPAVGVAAADAHGQVELSRRFAPKVPSYGALFGVYRNHVLLERPLTGAFAADSAAILDALARGRSYAALDALAPAGGLAFRAESGGRAWLPGDTAPATPPPRLTVGGAMPAGTRVVLLHDGQRLAEGTGGLEVAQPPSAGAYRVEAYVPGWPVPWVLTNAITLADQPWSAARAARAAWPAPAPAPPAQAVLADFDSDAGFFASGADPRSSASAPLWDAAAGSAGSGAARFAFRLGRPDEQSPHVFAALVNAADRDLSGRRGLVFSLRADGVYRMWVQVRDANPASPDGGTEWWFASVRTATEWQRVAVPFDRLRSIQKNSDGRLDPDKVKALVFIVDAGAMKPESSGTIWIDDLGVY